MNTSVTESWLASNSGNVINLLNPDPESITIEDIANNLSKLCRFNGQLKRFYSVANHSIHVARLVPARLKLQALLHDATEAYLCDVPTPVKALLGEPYRRLETRLAHAIGIKFKVNLVTLHPSVKLADRIMLVTERDTLQDKPQSWGPEYDDTVRYPDFDPYEPSDMAAVFMANYRNYAALTGE